MSVKLPTPIDGVDDLAELMREAKIKYRHLFELAALGDRAARREITGLCALIAFTGESRGDITRDEAVELFGAIWDTGAGSIPIEKTPAQGRGNQWRH